MDHNGWVTGGTERWPADAEAVGSWLSLPKSGGCPGQVRDLVPAGFDAYVRLFNSILGDRSQPLRWAQVAALNGRTFHPKVLLHEIFALPESGGFPVVRGWQSQPSSDQWDALGRVLRRHTTSDTFFIGMWTGSGLPKEAGQQELLQLPNREYSVVEARFDEWSAIDHLRHQLVNIVWPHDHAWFFNSDIDSPETYIAATADAAEDLLRDPELETALADPEDRLALY